MVLHLFACKDESLLDGRGALFRFYLSCNCRCCGSGVERDGDGFSPVCSYKDLAVRVAALGTGGVVFISGK